jgi:Domain of unknown function (DUF222)
MSAAGLSEGLAMIAAGLDMVNGTDWAALAVPARLATMETLETDRRLALAVSNAIAATVADEDVATVADEDVATLGDVPKKLVADVLRVTLAQADGRLKQAAWVRERTALTGEPLAPHLPATAQGWKTGRLDPAHVAEIVSFFAEIPADTPVEVQEDSEKFLAEKATELRPDQLKRLAKKLALTINPDGKFSEQDRVRKSGFRWESQRRDGMSKGVLWATPQLRAHLDAFFAKHAEHGMCLPDDDQPATEAPTRPATPVDDDQPATEAPARRDTAVDATDAAPAGSTPDSAVRDFRTPSQRRHDALNHWVRAVLGNPALGTHHGLPVTVVATATLADLETGAGYGLTATGTVIPMSDLINMAARSYRYLQIFRSHADRRVLDFYRARHCANGDQWLALFGRDRGCTRPGCDKSAEDCQAHHSPDFAANGQTNVDLMGLACYQDHPQLGPRAWSTRMRNGSTEWTPPSHYPRNTPATNDFHHPKRQLREFQADGDNHPHQAS